MMPVPCKRTNTTWVIRWALAVTGALLTTSTSAVLRPVEVGVKQTVSSFVAPGARVKGGGDPVKL